MSSLKFLRAAGVGTIILAASSLSAQTPNPQDVAPGVTSSASSARSLKAADRRLSKQVRNAVVKALSRDPFAGVTNISVISKNGHVKLVGTVPQDNEIAKAGEVAKGVAGVRSVDNRLTVLLSNVQ
jgi:hyperosmotically inducible periplasmic protein